LDLKRYDTVISGQASLPYYVKIVISGRVHLSL
jgi:hypothetical protein